MTAEPSLEAVLVLALVATFDVQVQVVAAQCPWVLAITPSTFQRPENRQNLLENGTVVYIFGGLAEELRRRISQDEPVLLEDAEVGSVAGLAVACD